MNDFYDEDKFKEIKKRVIENVQTREDVLELVGMVENLDEFMSEVENYLYDEIDVQEEENYP